MAAPIITIEVARAKRAGWPTWKVREITARGAVRASYECQSYREAVSTAEGSARRHAIARSAIRYINP